MAWMIEDGPIRIRRLRVGPLENNVYVVACANTARGILIDASFGADEIVAGCAGVEIEQLVATHGHFDHINAAAEVRTMLDVPFRIHPLDVTDDICDVPSDGDLSDGERIRVGDVEVKVVHTPGHTPGSVTFLVGAHAITGDTLFPGGPGATRWDYSSFETIIGSVRDKLFVLADETGVYPGHGDGMTTIGDERPSLQEWIDRGW